MEMNCCKEALRNNDTDLVISLVFTTFGNRLKNFVHQTLFSPGAGQRLTWYYTLKVGVNSYKGKVNLWFAGSISYQWDFIGFKRHYNQPQDDRDEHRQLPLVS